MAQYSLVNVTNEPEESAATIFYPEDGGSRFFRHVVHNSEDHNINVQHRETSYLNMWTVASFEAVIFVLSLSDNTVWMRTVLLTFRRKLLPPSSG
jgi:hypothetical protein